MQWFRKSQKTKNPNNLKAHSIVFHATAWFFPALALVLIVILGLVASELSRIRQWQVHLEKSLPITFTQDFRIDAAINHEFPIKLDTQIPVRFPVTSVVNIPIKETFMIPLDKTFPIVLDKPFHLKDTIKVRTQILIDTEVETKVMGIKMMVPVKGTLPLDVDIPLDQEIQITGELMVMLQEPLPASINQTVEAPLNFIVEGVMPLDTTIQAPVKGVLDCGINIAKSLPVKISLDISVDDLIQGSSFPQ